MPDLLGFKITVLGAASVSVPRHQIEAKIVDSVTQKTVLADFTGANALVFPAVLATLTASDRAEFAQMIATWLIMRKAGLG